MGSSAKYVSKPVDDDGFVQWTQSENSVWAELVDTQMECIQGRACDEYIKGLDLLGLSRDKTAQIANVNKVLLNETGWQVAPVPALINFDRFFKLLSEKKFPAATFLRTREDMTYLQEPDYFHEIFGHCAMLTNKDFAEFTHAYGKIGAKATKEDRVYLARLYWFTVEFGLVKHHDEFRIFGGGILSSPGETRYVFESEERLIKPFDPVDIMRTPYRIDIMQPAYFLIDSIHALLDLAHQDIMAMVQEAKALGLHAPLYPKKNKETEDSYV